MAAGVAHCHRVVAADAAVYQGMSRNVSRAVGIANLEAETITVTVHPAAVHQEGGAGEADGAAVSTAVAHQHRVKAEQAICDGGDADGAARASHSA